MEFAEVRIQWWDLLVAVFYLLVLRDFRNKAVVFTRDFYLTFKMCYLAN